MSGERASLLGDRPTEARLHVVSSSSGGAAPPSLSRLDPEAQLLFLTCGPDSAEIQARAQQVLARGVDGPRLLELVISEKATAVVWSRLGSLLREHLDGEVVEALSRNARVSEFRLLMLRERMRGVLRKLDQANIPAVLLKGAALASSAYRSFEERPMGDLDVLVPADRARDAQQLMIGIGWVPGGRADEHAYDEHHHLPLLTDASGLNAVLELHTDLFPQGRPFAFGAADVWKRAQLVERNGLRARVPSPNDQLLHCALHFVWSHMAESGAWRAFRDIQVLVAGGVDWPAFITLARESRGQTCCYWAFRLAQDVTGVPIPPSVLAALRPPRSSARLSLHERHFLVHLVSRRDRCPSDTLLRWMWSDAVMPGWSGHGDERPWTRDESFFAADEVLPRRGALARLAGHLQRVRRWSRYLAALRRRGA